jgi:hypothetical protein
MQQLGTVAGAPVQFLIDTGAELYNYISKDFWQRVGLPLRPCPDIAVNSIHDTSGVVAGKCTAVLTKQGAPGCLWTYFRVSYVASRYKLPIGFCHLLDSLHQSLHARSPLL